MIDPDFVSENIPQITVSLNLAKWILVLRIFGSKFKFLPKNKIVGKIFGHTFRMLKIHIVLAVNVLNSV